MDLFFAGIDWADQHHDVLVLDETGQQLGGLRVEHTREGLAKLQTCLEQLLGTNPKELMACIIETTHGVLITHLLEAGWPVYPLHPRTVDRRRSASGGQDGSHRCLVARQDGPR